ncbi:O-antigen ligase family protein [Candidatus Protofrankia californiensis]|uniref:O-antigen ligase family protein n=1 Tax=Candidatus Protofrankia californiensis TaxID=1839754 RepID=UPI001F49B1DD|nr:O-antigen ligase family protein [Candidatus Protofrankia californiensis]
MQAVALEAARRRSPVAERLGRPDTLVAVAATAGAALIGAALAERVWVGLALLVFALYVALAAVNLQLGIALWTPALFFEAVPALNLGAKAAGIVIVLLWLTAPSRRTQRTAGQAVVGFSVFRHQPGLVALGTLLLMWLSLSLLWAVDIGEAATDLWHWWALGLLFVVVSTAMAEVRAVRLASGAFLAGAVLSVTVGLIGAGPDPKNPAGSAGIARLQGGAGDPNFLAAWLLAGLILAVGLIAATRNRRLRWVLAAAVGVDAVGLASTLSRGAFVAALASALAALVLLRRQRRQVAGLILLGAVVAAAWLAASPAAWQRMTANDRGDGRVDLWTVAWSIIRDHPILGVGLNNYTVVESDYVRRVGPIPWVDIIVSRAHEVHNSYLQLFAENGIVGSALFLTFLVACLRTAFLAARRFEALGDRRNAALANAVLLATFSMTVSGFFLSNAVDKRLWFLLALGPALLQAAVDSPSPSEKRPSKRISGKNSDPADFRFS